MNNRHAQAREGEIHEPQQVSAAAVSCEELTWHDWLVGQARRAPAVFVSIFAHVVLLTLAVVLMTVESPNQEKIMQASIVTQKVPLIEKVEPHIFESERVIEKDLPIVEKPVDTSRNDDHSETDVDQPFDETQGDPRALSDCDLTQSLSHVNCLGIGGTSGSRFGDGRGGDENKGLRGATKLSEEAVLSALIWLKNHQSPDGSWDVDGYTRMCDPQKGCVCDGHGGTTEADPAVTGLAVLAYVGAGYTHKHESEFKNTISRALQYLVQLQGRYKDGAIATEKNSHSWFYGHLMATLALVESYDLTHSPQLKLPAQQAVDFIVAAQNDHPTESGKKYGWRYVPRGGDNDTSVVGWAVMALKSAKWAGFTVPDSAIEGAKVWLDDMTDPYYAASYQERGKGSAGPTECIDMFDRTESCTAIAVVSRIFLGETATSAKVRGGASVLMAQVPVWSERTLDYYYWYYGSLAMYQVGGDMWNKWKLGMEEALIKHQIGSDGGCKHGSWDPIDKWGGRGGRVYATAINALTMEVYYRYPRVSGMR